MCLSVKTKEISEQTVSSQYSIGTAIISFQDFLESIIQQSNNQNWNFHAFYLVKSRLLCVNIRREYSLNKIRVIIHKILLHKWDLLEMRCIVLEEKDDPVMI